MTAILWLEGRSSSFVPVRPQGPKKPCERDEHEHPLAKVSERHVHGNPPFRRALVASGDRQAPVSAAASVGAERSPPGSSTRAGRRDGIPLIDSSQKNFVLGLWRTTPPLTGGLTAYRFLADSRVVSHNIIITEKRTQCNRIASAVSLSGGFFYFQNK